MADRELTTEEEAMLEGFYDTLLGVTIDYGDVEIHDDAISDHQDDDTVMTVPNVINPFDDGVGIYYPKQPGNTNHAWYSNNFGTEADTQEGWQRKQNLIHEFWHVKAANSMTDLEYAVTVGLDARRGNYNYEPVFNDVDFEDLSHEQQAEFLGDYFLFVNERDEHIVWTKKGGVVQNNRTIEDYEDVLEGVDLDNIFNDDKTPTTEKQLNLINPEGGDSDAEDTDTYADEVDDHFEDAEDRGSPLVLDLDGDGIELTSLNSANAVYWDIDLDGFAEASGWVTGGDGLLAIDLNEDGVINNSAELFGNAAGYENGFLALAALDSNLDGLITSADSGWGDLLVWIDADGDSYSQLTELHTMDSLLISEIDLGYSDVSYTLAGNQVLQESTFTIDGNSRDIVDAYFSYSNLNTVYDQEYLFEVDALFLPDLRGYGTLPTLHISLSLDNDGTGNLLDLVGNFSDITLTDIFDESTDTLDDVREIMFRWAGVDGLSGTERGAFVDSRELGFLEKMMGTPFVQRDVWSNPLGVEAGEDLNEAFHIALNNVYARLTAQAAGGALFTGDWFYDIATDSFDGITGLDSTVLGDLETEATGLANTGEREVFWSNVLRMVEFAVGVTNLPGGDQTALDDAIEASDSGLDLGDLLAGLDYVRPVGVDETYTSGADTEDGSSGNDTLDGIGGNDTLDGLAGDDIIWGGENDDILIGNTGGDYLRGESGNDIYVYNAGDGDDVIREEVNTSGNTNDRILFGPGFDAGDLTFSRHGTSDLLIAIDNGSVTGSIVIENQFNYGGGGGHVEWIEFDDTSTINLETQTYTTYGTALADTIYGIDPNTGGSASDTIYAGAGNDTIYTYPSGGSDTLANTVYGEDGNDVIRGHNGAEILDGGAGNDNIRGGGGADDLRGGTGDDYVEGIDGDDDYFYDAGDGNDTYREEYNTSGNPHDRIYLGVGFDSGDLTFSRLGNTDLLIEIDNGVDSGSILIKNQFNYGAGGGHIEWIEFDDTSTINLETQNYTTYGTAGNDTIYGVSSITGGAESDTIYGGDGNDTIYAYPSGWHDNGPNALYGEDGDDTLRGSNGADILDGDTGTDTLISGSGNDELYGGTGDDYLEGGAGNDEYYYESGDGHDTYLETGNSGGDANDRIFFGAGIDAGDLTFSRLGTSDLLIEIDNGVDTGSILIENHFNYGGGGGHFEWIEFDDTSTINLETKTYTTYGTAGNDTIYGVSSITGGAEMDIIYGGDGNDTLYAYPSGWHDNGPNELYGEDGDDTLRGSNGADILSGGNGADTLIGNSGADTYLFEAASAFDAVDTVSGYSTGQNDKIDISDVLDGFYEHGVDVLTDFVEITTNGSNSEIRIDTSGTGSFGSGTHIATLTSVTGLTDEVALQSSGHLITH